MAAAEDPCSSDGFDPLNESEMEDAVALPSPPGPRQQQPPPPRAHRAGPSLRTRFYTPLEQCEMLCGRRAKELIDRRTRHQERFRPAEHILAARKSSFSHHGIYTSRGTVIHYCSDRGKKEPGAKMAVRETCFHVFVNGCTDAEVEPVKYDDCFDAAHTLRLARQSIGRAEFSLLANNCEHFASWCKKGVGVSEQVDAVEEVGKGAVSVAGGAAGGGYVASAVGSSSVPVVAGSTYLGGVAQNVLQHTTLGAVLSGSGVSTTYVVVPATAATIGIGLAIGAAVGGIGYSLVGGLREFFWGDDRRRVTFCVLRSATDGMARGAAGKIDADEEGLPVYGPVVVEAANRKELVAFARAQLPAVNRIAECWYFDPKRGTYEVLPADLDAVPQVASVCILLDNGGQELSSAST
eukprot:TRINITY_DN47644_c0_g1_i1.p1 TRINITY_DN47644_c0_g1~~TRINITY_DN47644_c0_g1_i1.p1  ORF type:complete len:408 (+),score=122.21 TRINITY_DN47644_c0_g1_i1:67-1290(+)